MISFKGMLLGIALSLAGTVAYILLKMFLILEQAHLPEGQQIGIDVLVIRDWMVHDPRYWILVLGLMAMGCAIVYFSSRSAAPTAR
jgi:hypothetical protein